jgi:hypothetical protein
MRGSRGVLVVRSLVVALIAIGVAGSAGAQPADRPLTALEVAVACAPPPSLDLPSNVPHVSGAQDTVARTLFNPRDLLVVDSGASNGLQLGQKFFIRRPVYAEGDRVHPRAILTLGWLSVVAVNDTTAIGSLDHFCDGISAGDYLEPYAAPSVPAGAERDEPAGDLDFSTLGRVVSGIDHHTTVGIGNLMLIDRGTEQGVEPGARFAIYRDLRANGLPLTSVAEGVVLSIGKSMSLARVTRSRDAVVPGDYVVPRK